MTLTISQVLGCDTSTPDLDLAHGNDPTRKDFGGQTFTSAPGGHSSYWDQNNPARDNIAKIVTGQDGEVR